MADFFDLVREEAKEFVSSAQPGDRVTVITFGSSSKLVERARIRSSYDKARILSEIDAIEPTEFATDLCVGMERGLKELQRFYEAGAGGERVLIWLSDDKDNPAGETPSRLSLISLKQRESGKLPDHNWFSFKAPIVTHLNPDVKSFIDWANRSDMELRVEPSTGELGILTAPKPAREFSIRFEPNIPAVRGLSFSLSAAVADTEKQYFSSVQVIPKKIICRGVPWTETIRVVLPDRAGSYRLTIRFVSPSDRLLKIMPAEIILRARVRPKLRTPNQRLAAIDAVMTGGYREAAEIKVTSMVRPDRLGDGKRPLFADAFLEDPIVPGGNYQVRIPLFPTKDVPLDSLRVKPSFELPAGLELRPAFLIAEGSLFADLSLLASEDLKLGEGWELRGMVSFASDEDGAHIYPPEIPVRFYTEKEIPRENIREISLAAVHAWLEPAWPFLERNAPKAGYLMLAVLLSFLFCKLIYRSVFSSVSPAGTLQIVSGPVRPAKGLIRLPRTGGVRIPNMLALGSSKRADLTLPHPSVADMHATFAMVITGAGPIAFVEPVGNNEVFVNGGLCSGRREIGDGDTLSLGDYVLIYKQPETPRETKICFADGGIIRGSPLSWDIASPHFEFLPEGAPCPDARMLVEFSELKAVLFIRKRKNFRRASPVPISRDKGRLAEVIFKDGESFEGYLIGEGSERSNRYYLIPKRHSEAALVLVERSAVQKVFIQRPTGAPLFGLLRFPPW